MSNELTVITIQNPLQVFSTPNGLDSIIDKIEAEAKSIDRDISTEAGRDNIRSLAFKLAKSKTFLDKMGKDLTEEQRAQISAVNSERKRAWERMEALQEEIRKPLTEWENKDKKRVEAHEAALKLVVDIRILPDDMLSGYIKDRIEKIPELINREWEEFSLKATQEGDATRLYLQTRYDAAVKSEKDAAELARLRAEEEARQRREHDERVAKEAAEKATREAEERAAREAEIERQRVEKELHEAAERQRHIEEKALRDKAEAEAALAASEKKAADDAAAAAKALKEAQEKAERDKQAALKKQADAAAAAANALKEAQEKAERDKQAALKKQADAAAAAIARQAAEDAKRSANVAHKKKINNEALEAIANVLEKVGPAGTSEEGMAIIEAIAKGEIPHVTIKY